MLKLRRLFDLFSAPLFFAALIASWELVCRIFAIPSFLLPAPSAILAAGVAIPASQWLGHVVATLRVALAGYTLAVLVSIPLAVLLTGSRLLTRTIYPLLVVVQSTPIVAIAPILVVTIGPNDGARILITFLIAFFPIVVATVSGLLATPEELVELSRSLKAGRYREVLQIRLPFAMPYIFSALKVSITLAIIGAVVAELVAADRGLGFFIAYATSMFRIPAAFAGLGLLVAISLGLFRLVPAIQRLVAPWSLPKR
jgi:NitT/TauT family transport system permease protein